MSGFDALLHLQELDTTLDQLRHRFETLPERAAVSDNATALALVEKQIVSVQSTRDGIARDQKRVEDEVAKVEAKATEVNTTLYSGSVKAPKELQALQDDFDSLKRRQRTLEDQVIALMETAEPVDTQLAELDERRIVLEREGHERTVALAEIEAAVEGELASVTVERAAAVIDVPAELVEEYDRLRPQYAGIAVARLVGSNCHGCHLALSAMALDRIRKLPPDALALCDECGRILIH